MANVWLFSLLSSSLIFVTLAEFDMVGEATYENEQCTAQLQQCSMKVGGISLNLLTAGDKGEMGHRGAKGEPGISGPPGEKGRDGIRGPPGNAGITGVSGEKGNKGEPGEMGLKGERGHKGYSRPAADGAKGDQGEKGTTGLQGPPGAPGFAGSCPCLATVEDLDVDNAKEDEKINTEICKEMEEVISGNTYNMGPGNMEVICKEDMDEVIWTCVPSKGPVFAKGAPAVQTEQFWMSSKKVSLVDIYGLTHTQIAWLQKRSNSAYQILRYHCKNSALRNTTNENASLLLLSWNDITFGPTPRESTPFVYDVPADTDECKEQIGLARSSVIKIKSDVARRLPVVDFLIRDLRDNASVGIEHLELCFN